MGRIALRQIDSRKAAPVSSLNTILRVLREEAQGLYDLSSRLDAAYETAVDWIVDCTGRVIACGVGKSGHIARKFSGTLASTGTPSLFLHAAEAVHGDLGMVTNDDVVVLFTYSGETDEMIRLFPSLDVIGAKSIVVTGRRDSSVARLAGLTLDCHVEREACPNNLAPTTSTTLMLAIGDALAVAAMERKGFSKEDFAKFHPSGTLGKRLLLRVSDVMRQGEDLAVVGPETPTLEVMQAITKAGAGAAIVCDSERQLLGLISDGDLRRHFMTLDHNLDAPAWSYMTKDPASIEASVLAMDALEMFQNFPKKIGEVPVVESDKVVGLLMVKDLLRSGII
ncbi:MAG: Arabinose 5-phosphate isomerase KpsF [Fimbriimonadaceae bacterium]|nr:Arabinose 5-phosphate isomerase KpsF [Fimbriimonadaceae bacterium]